MKFLKELFGHYMKSNTFEKGAALSYYVAFSFLPMIVIVISVVGLIFSEDTVSDELIGQLEEYFGHQAALQFENLIQNQNQNHNSLLNTVIGFVTLALASTAGFSQLQRSLNAIWEIKEKPKSSILNYVVKHLTFFMVLIVLGLVLVVSAMLGKFLVRFSENLPDFLTNARLYETLFSLLLIVLTMVALFRFLGSARVPWKNAIVTAGFTSILFIAGKEGISLYVAHSNLSSTFGAASIIALLMVWVFYTAQILYLGACFAVVYGNRYHCRITPDERAVRVVEKEVQ